MADTPRKSRPVRIKLDPRRTFGPVGKCIYCYRDDITLTSEHIVPQGLGGRLELLESSCGDCAKETGQVEQECLRKIFGPIRYTMGLSTRKKKRNPQDISVTIVNHDDSLETKEVSLEVHPHSFMLFMFDGPESLRGLEPRQEFKISESAWAYHPDKDDPAKATKYGGKGVRIGSFHPMLFSRMLAKIAHSFAVADQGLDSFIPYLPDLILGKYQTPSFLVGGQMIAPPAINALHRLHLYCAQQQGKQYLIVDIRLFANFGAPLYRVVVGEWKGREN